MSQRSDPFRRGNLRPDERGPRRASAEGGRVGGRRAPSPSAAMPRRTDVGDPGARPARTSAWSRRLRDVIEPFARAKPQVETEPTDDPHLRRLAGRAGRVHQPQPLQLPADEGRDPAAHRARIRQPPGRRLLRRQRRPRRAGRAREFTATEESLLGRLAEAMIGALAEVWSEIVPVRPQLRSRETNVGFADLAARRRAGRGHPLRRRALGRPAARRIEILYPVAAPALGRAGAARQRRTTTAAPRTERMARAARRRGRRGPDRGAHRARPARALALRADAAAAPATSFPSASPSSSR